MTEDNSLIQNETNIDSDDDCEEYFLQSTSGPYDIKEKIRVANDELFEDYEAYNIEREQKVTFREDLVDYEPDFSSDDGYVESPDVLSVISDHENEENDEQNEESLLNIEDNELFNLPNNPLDIEDYIQETVEEYGNFENNIFDNMVNEPNDYEIDDIQGEEIIDEYEEKLSEECDEDIEDEIEDHSEEQIVEVVDIINDSPEKSNETTSSFETSTDTPQGSITKQVEMNNENHIIKNPLLNVQKINCRLHCLEKKDIDFINGKPKKYDEYLKGPTLKLRQRSCCSNKSFLPKLPVYNGFISEYGMTKTQIEKKEKRKEKIIRSQRDKKHRIKEEKIQKDMYNEEIFCAWLKSLKTRNEPNKENKMKKNYKQRPQTAPHCNLSLAINIPKIKRPHTSSGCCFRIIID